jgi:hypothetical protein
VTRNNDHALLISDQHIAREDGNLLAGDRNIEVNCVVGTQVR